MDPETYEVRADGELVSFLHASLRQCAHGGLLFVMTVFENPERFDEYDRLCDAFTTNHVANRASRLQGRALLSAVDRIFPERDLQVASSWKGIGGLERPAGQAPLRSPFAHYAPVFGAVMRRLDFPRETAARLFFFTQVRSLLATAVRLNIVGPMDAQALQHHLAPRVEAILARSQSLTLEDLAQTAPLLDLWQAPHDRLYSRLFQS